MGAKKQTGNSAPPSADEGRLFPASAVRWQHPPLASCKPRTDWSRRRGSFNDLPIPTNPRPALIERVYTWKYPAMVHDGNKDEAEKCLNLAQKHFKEGNRDKAKRFAQKAERLYPTKETEGERRRREKSLSRRAIPGRAVMASPNLLSFRSCYLDLFLFPSRSKRGRVRISLLCCYFCSSCFWVVSLWRLCSLLLYSGISISLLFFWIVYLGNRKRK